MNVSDQLHRLDKQVRWLKLYCISVTAILGVVFLTGASKPDRFEELTAERINIVDSSGTLRLVLANAERFPAPIINGKPYPRSIKPAGLVYFNAKGDEVGGLALTDQESGRLSAFTFDYANSDALGLITHIGRDGKDSTAGLVINSRPPESLDVLAASRVAMRRIELVNRNEQAELVLSDSQGRPRLRVFVDKDDHPALEMLDEKGGAVYSVRR